MATSQIAQHLARDGGQVHPGEGLGLRGDAGEGEQILDQPAHARRGALHPLQVVLPLGGQRAGGRRLQPLAEGLDLPQRLLEIMRGDGREALQLAVGLLQLAQDCSSWSWAFLRLEMSVVIIVKPTMRPRPGWAPRAPRTNGARSPRRSARRTTPARPSRAPCGRRPGTARDHPAAGSRRRAAQHLLIRQAWDGEVDEADPLRGVRGHHHVLRLLDQRLDAELLHRGQPTCLQQPRQLLSAWATGPRCSPSRGGTSRGAHSSPAG